MKFGVKILELTGDTTDEDLSHDYSLYLEANLIITTPEKFNLLFILSV